MSWRRIWRLLTTGWVDVGFHFGAVVMSVVWAVCFAQQRDWGGVVVMSIWGLLCLLQAGTKLRAMWR